MAFESMLRQVTGKGHLGIAKLLVESGYSLESIELAEKEHPGYLWVAVDGGE
jgi:hypothetical protein